MMSLAACVAGFFLDFIFGDPEWLYHPVRLIGKGISFGERQLRKLCSSNKSGRELVAAGAVLWVCIAGISFLLPLGLLILAQKIHPVLRFVLETFWCYQIIAARCLCKESVKVYDRLKADDLPGARRAVSMIVGRDTENLSAEGVTKAAVETVAENTSDGVTAPLIYMLIGGAPLGFLYKAVNTMDSMLGYKNDKYLYFGRIPAKMDDVFNYIPSRVTALFMIVAAFFCGMDGKNAWRIYRRDRRKHASPNAAQTEAVCAGALRVRLAGDAVYFGKLYKKEFIGDNLRPIEPEDIKRTGRLMYVTAVLMLIVFGAVKYIVIML
ncbi:MAG TPA: adenosylcobinamide-phosphate synthase CbiB [Candidatus Mediterraneibacter gallistercoris]|uniref:Cobalamin biosynthesis protein CobD n=1 Tax=Candidatus Mediterraneibacter gallistercoris TaxID=2838671 RepID=A0A9D2P7Q3_9FIRM|nr:adenosylcobinamide-phosphate synthase CbiB [Candidatus Mediterraneibacter gallistercoris]